MITERSLIFGPLIWDKSKHFKRLIDLSARAANAAAEEKEKLARSLAAEILAATAYISGCADPERIVVSHLCTLLACCRVPVFDHATGESLDNRLQAVNHFPGGNTEAVKAGMLLLELLSLNDHKEDFLNDLIAGENNPLVTCLNYDAERGRILQEYNGLPGEIKDRFKGIFEKVIVCGFWLG